MSFVFMAFHRPEPGNRDTLAPSMRELRDRQLKAAGGAGTRLAPPDNSLS
jgi:hypothetical protein